MKTTTEGQPIDKSKWGPGPWQEEPDRLEWHASGYPCLMIRSGVTGSWCGYVGIPPWHPFYETPYEKLDLRVHGGLTYSDYCHGPICHVAAPEEAQNAWWLGFDCAHAFDGMPKMAEFLEDAKVHTRGYKDVEYVKKEVNKLAWQIQKLESVRRKKE